LQMSSSIACRGSARDLVSIVPTSVGMNYDQISTFSTHFRIQIATSN
jgi:hypothetical protein